MFLVVPKLFGYLGVSIFYRWYKMFSFPNNKCRKHKVVSSNMFNLLTFSVSNVVELPGAGLGRMIIINSELNGAT